MLYYDLYDFLYCLFSWTTLFRGLLLLLELYLCARLGMALAKRCARHPVLKRLATVTAWGIAAFCLILFPLRMVEDYAYVILGSESFGAIPDAMQWLVENGRESRLIRTVRAPSREDDIVWNNTRFFAALVLAQKNPEASRNVLAAVPPFERTAIDQKTVFGTYRYSFPVSGPDILRMQRTDSAIAIPAEKTD